MSHFITCKPLGAGLSICTEILPTGEFVTHLGYHTEKYQPQKTSPSADSPQKPPESLSNYVKDSSDLKNTLTLSPMTGMSGRSYMSAMIMRGRHIDPL